MNILFLTISKFDSVYQNGIYTDLLREFMNNGHEIYVVSSLERRKKGNTFVLNEDCCHNLKVRVGNITKTNIIEKGISTVMIESQYKRAISKYFSNINFDLIMYSTPPITLVNAIKYVKNRDNAKTYLLLKDIFPQNAVDIGIMSKNGVKSILYHVFRNKEKRLYEISDYIGCMSEANAEYVLKNNSEINKEHVEVCPNSVEVIDLSVDNVTKNSIRKKYGIPVDKKVFIYGGNLGKPQGIDFVIKCLKSQENNKDAFFLIVGDGTEFNKIQTYINNNKPKNVKLMNRLPSDDYDKMVGACDAGMIFLDHRFTIPNFPSRLLSYMQAKIPVLAVTDPNTDIGKIIVDDDFGWWCESDDIVEFGKQIDNALSSNLTAMGEKGFQYLKNHYSVQDSYKTIMNRFIEK